MSTGTVTVRRTGAVELIIPQKDDEKIKIKKCLLENYATVQIVNQTKRNVLVTIPNGGLLFKGADANNNIVLIVTPAGATLIVSDNPTNGIYPYSAYCDAISNFAEGNSAPEIHCPR